MSLLEIKNLSHSFGDRELYKNVNFELYKGEHMGVVGQNGSGKSTLIKLLLGETLPDKGEIKWQPNISIGKLDQHAEIEQDVSIFEYLQTAFAGLYKKEEKLNNLYIEMANSYTDQMLNQISTLQEILDKNNFYQIPSIIEKVAAGLGVRSLGMENKLSTLSGGQRAKVILAKVLLEDPDILILDEPTNFLDKQHVDWLEEYLTSFKGAFIIVSHDYRFLEHTTTCICDIEFQMIKKYKGTYSAYLKQKTVAREEYFKNYKSQQKEIDKLEVFIEKHIVRATSSKMAKDRKKKLEHMDKMEKPQKDQIEPNIHFKYLPNSYQIMLEVERLEVGYYYPLLPKIEFHIKNGQKIGITGFNGIGKSTLLKTIMSEIPPINGNFKFADNMKIGYYPQTFNWENPNATPIEIIRSFYLDLSEKEIRKALARSGLRAKLMMQEVGTLSGGEQAKVNICKLTLETSNILILDEPTNHLDEKTKESLRKAIKEYKGAVILVSHEEDFMKDCVEKILNIQDLHI